MGVSVVFADGDLVLQIAKPNQRCGSIPRRALLQERDIPASTNALLIVILAMSALTLRVLRGFLSRTRIHLQSAVRHGLANLYRPGNQSAAVLAALGTGVMLILSDLACYRQPSIHALSVV
jgi:hypothetical protein